MFETVYICCCSHVNKKTTFTDPRLAFATEEVDKKNVEIKQKFDASSSALQVLMGRDLSKIHAIVTGANSGIGKQQTLFL